jgi:hypothetical protein
MSAMGAVGATGCAAHEDGGESVAEADGNLSERPTAAGVAPGSLQEEGVLILANDRAVTAAMFESRASLSVPEAEGIQNFRTGPDGKPRWFKSIDEIDALPGTSDTLFQHLVEDATDNGYVEAPGFDDLTKVRITVPPNLGRPPTSNDVGIEAGFDGKSPTEVTAIVRSRLTNTIDRSNDRFVSQTIASTHKAFTIAVNNFFGPVSPPRILAVNLNPDRMTVLGTMSALHPTYLVAEKAGVTTYYTRGDDGAYQAVPTPNYPVIMRARIQCVSLGAHPAPFGVRVFYPAWSAKVLAAPTGSVSEGGSP